MRNRLVDDIVDDVVAVADGLYNLFDVRGVDFGNWPLRTAKCRIPIRRPLEQAVDIAGTVVRIVRPCKAVCSVQAAAVEENDLADNPEMLGFLNQRPQTNKEPVVKLTQIILLSDLAKGKHVGAGLDRPRQNQEEPGEIDVVRSQAFQKGLRIAL
ncbi:MAG: hypothetical protein ISS79_04280 [Phycisphaerae bacterium]|nr:hypothetical protein [Phycisphaerae bacterium]